MLGEPANDWRTERREAARAEIRRAPRALARDHGLTGWTLRDLAKQLGMAAPSLYSYFDSKDALFDAMFAQGNREMLALDFPSGGDLREALGANAEVFARFCCEDPVRYQLLFQRTIPGFEPSASSWELAQAAYEHAMGPLRDFGITDQADLDLVTGVFGGMIAQQLSNEPGGDRWIRLLDQVTDMLHHHFVSRRPTKARKPRTNTKGARS
jgi:AcrR family transcriptional regulator